MSLVKKEQLILYPYHDHAV